jgi:alpha-glucosidase
MPWDGGRNGGFSPAAEADLWLPVAPDYEQISVEAQLADPDSILNLYRSLFSLRAESPALREGSYVQHPASDRHCFCYWREADGDRKLVALNMSAEDRELALGVSGTVAVSTARSRSGRAVVGKLSLAPNEGVVIEVGIR